MGSKGLRVANGNAASAYILYRKLEKRISTHIQMIREENKGINTTKLGSIDRYLDKTEQMCLNRLNGINALATLRDYLRQEDINRMV